MQLNSSKEKGDIGLTQIIADLTKKNIQIALPISEHLPFDLIAIDTDGELARISVKYREINKEGVVEVPLRTISNNSQGYKIKIADLNKIDGFAIYCPTTEKCYYVDSKELKGMKNTMSLRIKPLNKNYKSNIKKIKFGDNYLDYKKIFKKGSMAESGLKHSS